MRAAGGGGAGERDTCDKSSAAYRPTMLANVNQLNVVIFPLSVGTEHGCSMKDTLSHEHL